MVSTSETGGYLFFIVPDEDLYEQGVFPSRFNSDHKATFTISKTRSWSPKSYNVFDLARSLPGAEIFKIQLCDIGYNRARLGFGYPFAPVRKRLVSLYVRFFPIRLEFMERMVETL